MQLIPSFSATARTPVCSICGQGPGREFPLNPLSSDRPVLSLGLDIEWEGSVEICMSCATEIGHLAGMISVERAEELRAEATEANAEVQRLTDELTATQDFNEALKNLLPLVNKPEPEPVKPAPTPRKKAAPK